MDGCHHKSYKDEAIIAAKELGYGRRIIEKIQNAKSETEIQNIMITARKEKFDGIKWERNEKISPGDFVKAMQSIINNNLDNDGVYDCELGHLAMDNLMCDVLRRLGYGGGVDIFENSGKYYA